MPDLALVDAYRRLAAYALGRRITEVVAPDAWYLRQGLTASVLDDALVGRRLDDVRRAGAVLLLHTDGHGPVLVLRFGDGTHLLVDGMGSDGQPCAIDTGARHGDRLALGFADGVVMRILDPRRLGGVELQTGNEGLGAEYAVAPEATTVTPSDLHAALVGNDASLKTGLLDHERLASVSNVVADEILWRAGLDPDRPSGSLHPDETRRLHEHLQVALRDCIAGRAEPAWRLVAERRPGALCPHDATPLVRRVIDRRITWSCPRHQR